MFNENTIPSSYKTGSQSPLESKGNFADLDDMKDTSNLRPLGWYLNMNAKDVSTGVEYVWKESVEGLIDGGYTYPDNIVSFGITYSLKTFNFVLKNKLPSFTVIGTNFGRFNDGDIVPEHTSVQQRFQDAYTKQILPTFINPTNPSLLIQNTNNRNFERGEEITLNFAMNYFINDSGGITLNEIGRNLGIIFSDPILGTFSYTYTGTIASDIFKSIVSFAAGTTPKDDNLVPPNSIPNTIEAQTIESAPITIYFRRPIFYGAGLLKHTTDTAIRANLTKVLEHQASTLILNTNPDEGVGMQPDVFQVFVPTGLSLISVIDLDALNANITSEYIGEPITIEYLNGNNYSGTLYTKIAGVPYTTNHRHQITIG